MSDTYTCPRCGGVSDFSSTVCQYCGTPFLPQGGGFGVSGGSPLKIADLEAQAAKKPNDPKLLYALGEAYHKAGDYDKAGAALEKAAAAAPGEADIPYLQAWNAGIKSGWECVKVAQYAERAAALKPDYKQALAVKLLNQAAQKFMFDSRDGQDEVLGLLNQALQQDPENTYIYMYAASVYEAALQRKDAIAVMQKAAELSLKDIAPAKEDARVFARLGYLYYKDGNAAEAKKYLDKAIALDPENYTAKQLERSV